MNQSLDPMINKEETTEKELNEQAEIVSSEETSAAPATEEEQTLPPMDKEAILEKLKDFTVPDAAVPSRAEVEALKQAFYRIRSKETEEEKAKYIADGNEEESFTPSADPKDDVLKTYLGEIKAKRARQMAEEESQKEENYQKKLAVIEAIKALTESTDDFNKLYKGFKDLQQQWNDIKQVPASKEKDLWRDYQRYTEVFYDLIKINNEFRDYDFKKNLELKIAICEATEKLDEETDIVSAFHQLQNFHQQWREIGPVAKELREELWERFKTASTAINKKYQTHFESLKGKEEENLEKKRAICETLSAIDYSALTSMKLWDEKSKEVIALQAEWKTIGFVPKKYNTQIFEEFRSFCDKFFEKKSEFFKGVKEDMDVNLEKKRALCERANQLKDSTDWKKTTDEMIAIQKEWKTIGPVPRKYSDTIWKEFVTACDYFFEQKKKNTSSQKDEEEANLKAKKEIIEKVKAIDTALSADEVIAEIRKYTDEWHTIGFVPFKEKDKIYKQFHEAVDAHYDRLKVDKTERRLDAFKSNLEGIAKGEGGNRRLLLRERDRLLHTYNKLKSDLQTYENNMNFLSLSSKGASTLLKDVNIKIKSLRDEMELIAKKVEAIDKSLDSEE
ncbi:DUF349 domain-containing protein [Dysgonomonas sp. 25]|uniref:DUF349 domain-containing protein n=1 Tax=Dysgonomonas sp. 25 TaxID=2302933 RepID=UPI0013D423B3|nr:DUF349 domain-containing protein [Dysgonomonas sp. 25]NDV67317.1 DUF349 domain-containing protein [Dysgonomonas sp. 25]